MPVEHGSRTVAAGTGESGPAAPDPAGPPAAGGSPQPRRLRPADFVRSLVSLGPFAAALAAYSFLLDQLKEEWFTYSFLYFLFAGVCALCVGLVLRLFGQVFLDRIPASVAGVPTGALLGDPAGTRGGRTGPTVQEILKATVTGIVADYREASLGTTTVYGWSQYISDQVPPTAIGTAYGLELSIMLDIRDPRINRRRLVDTLLALQRPGGGWAASTQRGIGRPEVSAWVLGAAIRSGLDPEVEQGFVQLLEEMVSAPDPVAWGHTSVVALMVDTLADIAPQSARLTDLARLLVDGASVIAGDTVTASWGESLFGRYKESVPHTARAVTALAKAARVRPGDTSLINTAHAGVEWLARGDIGLGQTDEQLRRPVPGGSVDALFIGHFTAALVAQALMSVGNVRAHGDRLRSAVREVIDSQEDGVWTWHDSSRPIWMTAQGATVLRDYALLNLAWPP